MDENRSKYKSMQSASHHMPLDCINPQPAHGSSYHVHPFPSPIRLQHAFQVQKNPKMFYPKGLKPHFDPRSPPHETPILGRALCLTPKGSPLPGRVSHLNERFHDSLDLTTDTDALLKKISAMFPTVSDTHIKILLKKYYNREAVVISALQVEKHPITTPGPFSMSPLAGRLQRNSAGVYSVVPLARGASGPLQGSTHFTPILGTPQGSPMLLRPGSGASNYFGTAKSVDNQPIRPQSPKMKIKYLKSIFPKAEETLILHVLGNQDNNVQKASEELVGMGFIKKDNSFQKKKENHTPQPVKKVVMMKTAEEKNSLKEKMKNKFLSIPERVVTLALESVEYNEERAMQILSNVLAEETPLKGNKADTKDYSRPTYAEIKKPPILKSSTKTETKYKSLYTTPARGPNPILRQGPKDNLLLDDYIPWTGPNPIIRYGQTAFPKGPQHRENTYTLARGPSELAKGPAGVAKGSVYQKVNKKSATIIG